MKLIIAGSRTLHPDVKLIDSIVQHYLERPSISEIISGCAVGVDKAGEGYVEMLKNFRVTNPPIIKRFPADWVTHGRAAGPIRNMEMAAYADALLLIWDGQSSGSANMKQCMINKGKPVYEVILSRTKG